MIYLSDLQKYDIMFLLIGGNKIMLYFWIATFVFLVIAEATTAQLVTIWFAVGALGALIANL